VISLLVHELYLWNSKKSVWISATKELVKDAASELKTVYCPLEMIQFTGRSTLASGAEIMKKGQPGIIFTAYTTLTSGQQNENLFQLADWMGAGYAGLTNDARFVFAKFQK